MNNRKLTIIFLFISYVLVLGHSIFPHEHHDENVLINTSQYHASEDHSHSSDFILTEVFKNYNHSGEKEIFTINHFSKIIFSSKTKFQSHHYKIDQLITDTSPPPLLYLQIDKSVTNFKKILYRYSGLRAPPLS